MGSSGGIVPRADDIRPLLEKDNKGRMLGQLCFRHRHNAGQYALPQILPDLLQSPINAGACAMMAGLVIVPVVSLLTPKPDQKFIDDCFRCYDTTTQVALKFSLPDEEDE